LNGTFCPEFGAVNDVWNNPYVLELRLTSPLAVQVVLYGQDLTENFVTGKYSGKYSVPGGSIVGAGSWIVEGRIAPDLGDGHYIILKWSGFVLTVIEPAAPAASTPIATRTATRLAPRTASRKATLAATRTSTRKATFAATRKSTPTATLAATRKATLVATRKATLAATQASTRKATFAATRKATLTATRKATWTATRKELRTATRKAK